ncbi:MAG: hypothetical protein KGL39_32235 [Patescibacteria group bacterium]|nr:hypothetical protein [Patescibacteria group bacterium]
MKVYAHSDRPRTTLFVSPGKDHPENSAWVDKNHQPIMLTVIFNHGVADVEANFGRYLVAKGLASKSPIILPAGVAA